MPDDKLPFDTVEKLVMNIPAVDHPDYKGAVEEFLQHEGWTLQEYINQIETNLENLDMGG